MNTLQRYLNEHKLTQKEFGALIGCSQGAVHRYACGLRIPRPRIMRAIARVTNNEVPVSCWLSAIDTAEPEAERVAG